MKLGHWGPFKGPLEDEMGPVWGRGCGAPGSGTSMQDLCSTWWPMGGLLVTGFPSPCGWRSASGPAASSVDPRAWPKGQATHGPSPWVPLAEAPLATGTAATDLSKARGGPPA